MPILINRKGVATLLGILSPIYWNATVWRVVMASLFMVLRKRDQKRRKMSMSEGWGSERSLWSYVWWGEGEQFGSPPFQDFGRLFSRSNFNVSCCNSLSLCPFTIATPARGSGSAVTQPSGLPVLSIRRAATHASPALFSRRTNTSSVLHGLRAYVSCCMMELKRSFGYRSMSPKSNATRVLIP